MIARECFELMLSHDWLTKHHKGLVALWYECKNPHQRALIKTLLKRFNYIDYQTYLKDCEAITEVICKKWKADAKKPGSSQQQKTLSPTDLMISY